MARTGWAILATALGVAVAALPPSPPPVDPSRLLPSRHYDVRVLRDTWGVPHVFGRTDADAAYGLAWAHAEDDFDTIQGALLAARGRLATRLGPDGAPNDYLVQLLRVREAVDAGYERDLLPATRALCEAYAEGINHYAARHPDRAWPGVFPVQGKDVIAGFVHKLPLFYGLGRVLTGLMADSPPASPPPGSNAFAIAPSRSADGATRLLVNSHQPWDGPVAWYEAHVRSDEGWDAVGGVFPGAPVILHGHNRNLGWAHTVNEPDLIDVYELEVNPDNPRQYFFDGAWRDFEVRTASIDVKVLGPIHWTARRETLWAVHGPAIRGPRGTYALRLAGFGDVRPVEQWYRMNKARSFAEWTEAMRMLALPMFNVAYADAEGHIAYVYNARLPRRPDGFDWADHLPGDTSAAIWHECLSFDELPKVVDPPSGFLQTCNGTPFRTTTGEGNPDPSAFARSLGIESYLTNRGLRALELLGGDPSITADELDAYKCDVTYSAQSAAARNLAALLAAPPPQDERTFAALQVVRRWDRRADVANPATALALLAFRVDEKGRIREEPADVLMGRLREAARALESRFGRLGLPWSEVNRLRRGTMDIGIDGGPDLLRAVYSEPAADGRRRGVAGDSYVLVAEWDKDGRVRSKSIHQFGSATKDERSPHFADQAALFARCGFKPVWLDETEIRAHLEREYRPGE
ncbi:MAG TPA: acylase [Vicinamibacteria bacterium]|nr:acylase [Vicinamibacteria bacterium]